MKPPGLLLLSSLAAGALRVWIIAGILLRVTGLRDRVPGLSLVFYTTPWPVMAAAFVLLALHGWRRGNRRALVRYVLFTGGALFTWVATSWRWTPEPTLQPDLRVVLWNVGAPDARVPQMAAWLRAQDADVIALAEAGSSESTAAARWQAELPGFSAQSGPGKMLCLVRGEVLEHSSEPLATGSFLSQLRVESRGHRFRLLQTDLRARPIASRREPLRRLAAIVNEWHSRREPLIVLGDFNTPQDSAHFGGLRSQLTNCFEMAGRGFAETWPSFLPVLSLDQMWVSSDWTPLLCRHFWTLQSDHQPVVVDLQLASPFPTREP